MKMTELLPLKVYPFALKLVANSVDCEGWSVAL